jgi:hypothetical protein
MARTASTARANVQLTVARSLTQEARRMLNQASSGFFVDLDEDGHEVMVLRESWNSSHNEVMALLNIRRLRLSESAGWRDTSLDFVNTLTNLISLEIYSYGVTDLGPIASLSGLEKIGLNCRYKKEIDFSIFPELKTLLLNWRSGAESLEGSTGLRVLNIMNYPFGTLENLSRLSLLETLKITSSKLTTLEGTGRLSHLLNLDLFRCTRLEALTGIESNPTLTDLSVDCCRKFSDLQPLQSLETLEEIGLNDCGILNSLAPLRPLKSLRRLFFVGTTKIADGDLSLFEALPSLRSMVFRDRKNYTHTNDHISSFLATR